MADGSAIRVTRRARPFLAADLFCGAGGTSTGAMRALRELFPDGSRSLVLTAVNHWPVAIETHTRNHPEARHHCADLESARPRELVPEGYLDLLMASPTCTYHSRARGGRPVHDQQRMDPWHVHRWCTDLRVARLLVENVPEFIDWGPCSLVTGRPIPSRKGEYFRAWLDALRSLGFRLDYRVLCCADYGDPTTRERFFLIARSDRGALRWPEPSHARGGSQDLLGARARWRGAAEIIDWATPGKSIFTRKKPLAANTLRRILAGAQRYGWPAPYLNALRALLDGREPTLDVSAEEAAPFLLHFRGTNDGALGRSGLSIEHPVPTLTAGGGHVGIVMATGAGGTAREVGAPLPTLTGGGDGGARPHFIEPLLMGVASSAAARLTSEPAPTITTGGGSSENRPGNARPQLIVPLLVNRNSDHGSDVRAKPVSEPMPTATSRGAGYIASPLVTSYYGFGGAVPADDPLATVTTKDRFGAVVPVVFPITHSGDARVRAADEPLPTITTANRGEMAMSQPFLVPNFGEREGQAPRVHDITDPLPAVTATGHIQLAQPAATAYRIDILYRMLHWRELARAMSFDDEGEVYDFAGNATEITKQIGNAVPGRTAKALIRALMEGA